MNRRSFFNLASFPLIPALLFTNVTFADDEDSDDGDKPTDEGQELTTEQRCAEALGAMMVAYVTQCHLSVGLIADSFVQESMDEEQANAVLELTQNFISQIEPKLTKLSQVDDLSDEDIKAFKESAEITRLILREIEALSGFIESGEEDDRKKYGKAREKAQARFDKLFQAK